MRSWLPVLQLCLPLLEGTGCIREWYDRSGAGRQQALTWEIDFVMACRWLPMQGALDCPSPTCGCIFTVSFKP